MFAFRSHLKLRKEEAMETKDGIQRKKEYLDLLRALDGERGHRVRRGADLLELACDELRGKDE